MVIKVVYTAKLYLYSGSSVVVSAFALINVVNRHWAQLLFGWMTARGQVNHLSI